MAIAIPAFKQWHADYLRFSVFAPQLTPNTDQLELWWNTLSPAGELEDVVSKPKMLEHILKGSFGDLTLELRATLGRIDVILRAPDNRMTEDVGCGVLAVICDDFIQSVKRWLKLEVTPAVLVDRLAFGTLLLLPIPDVKTGYQNLSSLLPFVTLEEGWSDFMLQINKPQNEHIQGFGNLKFNFITRTGVSSFHRIIIEDNNSKETKLHFNRIEYDTNTDVDNKNNLSEYIDSIIPILLKI